MFTCIFIEVTQRKIGALAFNSTAARESTRLDSTPKKKRKIRDFEVKNHPNLLKFNKNL